jgi:hypothetical protein
VRNSCAAPSACAALDAVRVSSRPHVPPRRKYSHVHRAATPTAFLPPCQSPPSGSPTRVRHPPQLSALPAVAAVCLQRHLYCVRYPPHLAHDALGDCDVASCALYFNAIPRTSSKPSQCAPACPSSARAPSLHSKPALGTQYKYDTHHQGRGQSLRRSFPVAHAMYVAYPCAASVIRGLVALTRVCRTPPPAYAAHAVACTPAATLLSSRPRALPPSPMYSRSASTIRLPYLHVPRYNLQYHLRAYAPRISARPPLPTTGWLEDIRFQRVCERLSLRKNRPR